MIGYTYEYLSMVTPLEGVLAQYRSIVDSKCFPPKSFDCLYLALKKLPYDRATWTSNCTQYTIYRISAQKIGIVLTGSL